MERSENVEDAKFYSLDNLKMTERQNSNVSTNCTNCKQGELFAPFLGVARCGIKEYSSNSSEYICQLLCDEQGNEIWIKELGHQ